MTKLTKRFALPAALAAISLVATPVVAADLPTTMHYEPAQARSDYGWGWGGGHRYRHRGRTSAGDVLGAVIVLGTIAAVASAASKANRERSYPYPNRYPYPDRRGEYRPSVPRGVEGAADLCLREIERDARVEDVANVERNASGWIVTGAMADGEGFTCTIGADGRIERIEVGGRPALPRDYEARYGATEGQYDNYDNSDRDVQVEADSGPLRDYPGGVDADTDVQADDGPQPAYPGGPLPGDEDVPENDPV